MDASVVVQLTLLSGELLAELSPPVSTLIRDIKVWVTRTRGRRVALLFGGLILPDNSSLVELVGRPPYKVLELNAIIDLGYFVKSPYCSEKHAGLEVMKVMSIGSRGAGKTALLSRYTRNGFSEDYRRTMLSDFREVVVSVGTYRHVNLQLWEPLQGKERCKMVSPAYYRGVNPIFVMFDLTDHNSFDEVPRWLQDVRAHCRDDVFLVLIACKVDLVASRKVDAEEVQGFVRGQQLLYFETSAKENIGVDDAIHSVLSQHLDVHEEPEGSDDSTALVRLRHQR